MLKILACSHHCTVSKRTEYSIFYSLLSVILLIVQSDFKKHVDETTVYVWLHMWLSAWAIHHQSTELLEREGSSWITYINTIVTVLPCSGYLIYPHCLFNYCLPPTSKVEINLKIAILDYPCRWLTSCHVATWWYCCISQMKTQRHCYSSLHHSSCHSPGWCCLHCSSCLPACSGFCNTKTRNFSWGQSIRNFALLVSEQQSTHTCIMTISFTTLILNTPYIIGI